jgi:hypothetical protein
MQELQNHDRHGVDILYTPYPRTRDYFLTDSTLLYFVYFYNLTAILLSEATSLLGLSEKVSFG